MSDAVALRDVARAAGVSIGTASNVWRRPDVVADATRRRVLDAAATLGFDGPHPAGRLLRTRAAHCVGVVVDRSLATVFRHPYYLRLMEGVAEACAERGSGIALISTEDGGADGDGGTAPWSVASALVDGFIVFSCGPDGNELVARCARRGLPIVGIDAEPSDAMTTIRIDDRAAARDVMRAVLARGHRRIGVASLHTGADELPSPPTREAVDAVRYVATRLRLHGYLDALEAHGGDDPAELVATALAPEDGPGDETEADGDALVRALVDADVDAVVAMSDVVARELRRSVERRAQRAPPARVDAPEPVVVVRGRRAGPAPSTTSSVLGAVSASNSARPNRTGTISSRSASTTAFGARKPAR